MVVESLDFEYLDYDTIIAFFNSPPDQDEYSFTLGGDFEGLILKPNRKGFIPARETEFDSTSPTAWVGKDGSGYQVEFRFECSRSPHIVIDNFEKSLNIFKNWAVLGNSSGLVFGHYSYSQPLGGHIHFGKSSKTELLKKLDYYMAVPILLISNPRELILRCKTNYGKLSAMETKSYGFEYRTLPNFAINRELTTQVFVLAGLIADQYHNMAQGEIDTRFIKNYYRGNKDYFIRNHLSLIKNEILRIASERFSNWGWAFYQIFKFLSTITKAEIIISGQKEVLRNWNLIPNNFLNQHKIEINSDDYLKDIIPYILEEVNIYSKLDRDLLIYGVKDSRSSEDYEIWVSDSLFKKIVNSIGIDKIDQIRIKSGKFGAANSYIHSVGLSFKLRKKIYDDPYNEQTILLIEIVKEVIKKCVE